MSAVGDDCAVFHCFEMFFVNYVAVARDGNKEISDLAGFRHGHHAETVHYGFDCLDRIDFGNDHICTHSARTHRTALAAPAVADDYEIFSGKQNIGRADDSVQSRLSRAVAVIKEMFGLRVIDSHCRKCQNSGFRHCVQTNDSGCRFFGRADDLVCQFSFFLEHRGDNVRTVINNNVRACFESGAYVAHICFGRFAFDRHHRNAVFADQSRRHIILRRKRIRSDQQRFRAARLQGSG